ncbi:MAG: polysaccharide deacetylase family protein [Bacteroidales bacterium]
MSDINDNYIALSFDVEDWYHTPLVTGSSFSKYPDIEDFLNDNNTDVIDCITEETLRLLDILDSYKVTATFFIVSDVAERYDKIRNALKGSRHEIASHSSTHKIPINSDTKQDVQSHDVWYKELLDSKMTLEKIFETKIIGYRAPGAYFANWMVPLLEQAGFKYDSSIAYNSLYSKTNIKLKNIPSAPYLINAEKLDNSAPASNLTELPWSNLKVAKNIILPVGGAYFFRLLGYKYFKHAISKALKNGDTMFYMHPYDISTKKIPAENGKRPLFWINKGLKTERKFIKLLKEYKGRFRSCKDVYYKSIKSE